MEKFFLILKLLPYLFSVIQQIETTAAVPKAGPAKLKVLTDTISTALKAADGTAAALLPETNLASTIEALTTHIVSFFNLVGVFRKSA